MRADEFRVTGHPGEITISFAAHGAAEGGRRILLSPGLAGALLHNLIREMPPTAECHPIGFDLEKRVRELGVDHGREDSVKMVRGALLTDRFLLSLHRDSLGAGSGDRIRALCRDIGMPPAGFKLLDSGLKSCDMLHFGFESGQDAPVLKVYMEFAEAYRKRLLDHPDTAKSLLHTALKWAPGSDQVSVTRYTAWPLANRARIEKLLTGVFGRKRMLARPFVEFLLNLVEGRMPIEGALVMDVVEQGTSRRSFDLNVYGAGLRVVDVIHEAVAVGVALKLDEARVRTSLANVAAQSLGHISGGLGRDGEEFLTIYSGVREASDP